MAVEIETLFTSALGLAAPWRVDNVELNTAQKPIDFKLICDAEYLPCPLCHKADQSIHYRLQRHWRHLDFFQYEAWLHPDQPRVKCEHCGKTAQVDVPWGREGSGFTLLFEALALALCQNIPVRQAAELLRCNDKQLWRRIEHYITAVHTAPVHQGGCP